MPIELGIGTIQANIVAALKSSGVTCKCIVELTIQLLQCWTLRMSIAITEMVIGSLVFNSSWVIVIEEIGKLR
jgi:hypothetical protein